MIEVINQIVNDTLLESETNETLQDTKTKYEAISIDLNIYKFPNFRLNTLDLYGFNDHPFILGYIKEQNVYFIVDLSLEDNCMLIDDNLFNKYIESLGISNNLTLKEIYNRSNAK